ncbi:MAG TPA: PilZ domain-containing protein [Sphingomicrobium sp.]|nr:PilZ domain-containing protein [Sphingomicrobium sp.]
MDDQPVETTLYSLSDRPPDPVERRDDERYLTLFRVGTVMINDRRELCLIKNISAGGMMIRPYCKLEVGDKVSVELKRGEQIPGYINWVRQDSAGIAFNERIDVVELLATSMEGPRPRMPRVEVRCIASVRQGANVYGMRAHDVSQGGVKVESERELEVGGDVLVTLPGLPSKNAVVRWRQGRSYGITFRRLIALAELVEWLRSQRELLRASS